MLLRLRHLAARLADAFWVIPAGLVLTSGLLAFGCLALDRGERLPTALMESAWLYNGGPTGARTLLGAVAASAIGVAGTVFSITIAALSLAAGQMGPRLLRNFVRDRGNQWTLGVLLGTFTYSLMVLRSVRTMDEGGFTPHLSMTAGILLALCSVAMLIYFVGHVATRINVDTVIALVGADLERSLQRFDSDDDGATTDADAAALELRHSQPIASRRSGYLQGIDIESLMDWAVEHDAQLRLAVRPGQYVFPGAATAWVSPATPSAQAVVENALVVGPVRTPDADVEYATRQLVEVAMRALSPGINDPYSAISVLDRLGGALCELVDVRLPSGRHARDGRVVVQVPTVDYDGLTDTMFHPLRQYGSSSAMVLIHMLDVLTAVAGCERDAGRLNTLRRHAGLVLAEGDRSVASERDRSDLHARHEQFLVAAALAPSQYMAHARGAAGTSPPASSVDRSRTRDK